MCGEYHFPILVIIKCLDQSVVAVAKHLAWLELEEGQIKAN